MKLNQACFHIRQGKIGLYPHFFLFLSFLLSLLLSFLPSFYRPAFLSFNLSFCLTFDRSFLPSFLLSFLPSYFSFLLSLSFSFILINFVPVFVLTLSYVSSSLHQSSTSFLTMRSIIIVRLSFLLINEKANGQCIDRQTLFRVNAMTGKEVNI